MNINTNLAGLAYIQKQSEDTLRPWIYDDDAIEPISEPQPIVINKQKPKRKPRLRRSFAVILNIFKK